MTNPIVHPEDHYRTLKDLEELKRGMIIAEDIVNQRGNVLITAGFVVEDARKLVQFLSLHKVTEVKIQLKPGSETEPQTILQEPPAEAPEKPAPPKPPVKPVSLVDPAVIQAEEERRYRQRKIKETRDFQNRYMKQREVIKSDFERIIKGEPVTRDELEDRVVDILKNIDGIVNAFQLIESIKKDSRDLFAHYYHVTLTSHYIGTWMELPPKQMKDLTLSALLHDLGKEQVSPELILKQEELTGDELLEYQKHVVLGYELVKKYDFLTHPMMQAILLHHERFDGSGYPLGLKGEKIPMLARIVAIADVYNTLTIPKGKQRRRTPFEAVRILESEYMNKLDPRILYVFLNRIGNCFLGQEVKLNDQRVGEIIFVPRVNVYRPIIKLKSTNQLIDLSHPDNLSTYIHSFT